MKNIEVIEPIYDWLEEQTKERIVLLYGGSSAGKSYTLKQFIIWEKLLKEKNMVWYVLRKTNPSLKKTVYKLMVDTLQENNIPFTENKSDQFIIVNSNTVYFTSLDDPEKIKSVEANYVFLEEATEFTEADWKRTKISIRRQNKIGTNQIYLCFNPVSTEHWIYKVFWREKEKAAILKCTYKENPFLTQDDIDTLENEKDSYYYTVYTLGNFGILDNNNAVILAENIQASLNTSISEQGGLDIGVDVARFGDDEAVIYYKIGGVVHKPVIYEKCRITDLEDGAVNIINQYRIRHNGNIKINVDVTGIGGGLIDNLFQRYSSDSNVKINEINFGGSAKNKDKYANTATEMYFEAKDKLSKNEIMIYNDDVTINQLTSRTYKIDNKSRYILLSKDEHKKKTGESPDRADGFVLMCYDVESNEIWLL